ncbi:MAG TPA: DUF3305 domain-containing protein [Azospirillaceae bacterium]|nr:DUF3305 domain-containing protein [Azospirillaceae bacterium]
MAAVERMPVGVVVERQPARSRWLDHVWRVAAVLPGDPETPPWTLLAEEDGTVRYYAGTAPLEAHSADTKVYKHNLEAPEPAVYVVLRPGGGPGSGPGGWRLLLATVDPAEAHAHSDCGDDLVEALPMPQAVRDWLAAFVARHHVERQEWRRKRDRADPEILAARRARRLEDGDG